LTGSHILNKGTSSCYELVYIIAGKDEIITCRFYPMIKDDRNKMYELAAFSAAALYLELAIIRFAAAEVLYLGYFSNFILISAFVGLGLGFLCARSVFPVDKYFPFFLLFLFALVLTARFDADTLRNHFGLFFFGNVRGRAGLPGALLLFILFITTVMLFMGLGRRIAIAFSRFRSLQAYSIDITGSLAGILIFSLQSYAASSPVTWIITGFLLIVTGYFFSRERELLANIAFLLLSGVCVIILLLSSNTGNLTTWSPYQKLEMIKGNKERPDMVLANGIVHQFLHPAAIAGQSFYAFPYRVMDAAGLPYKSVLVIGAGTGTDVAVAIDNGAENIDAVEIDPEILEIGKRFHPDQPYANSRVRVHTGDGREFLTNTDRQYDLIVFALPDSLMRISAMSSVRLESYLFTLEAFALARQHLTGDGVFVMYNEYRWQWLVNKLANSLELIFGRPPLIMTENTFTVLLAGPAQIGSTAYVREGYEKLATDDWPFIYMQSPGIHWLFAGMIAMFLLASIAGVALFAPSGTLRQPDLPFFCMGMAFMLLETRSLAFFSLLFGTTWLVNSLAFAGILLSVLFANLLVQSFNIRMRTALYLGLFGCLFIAYLIPPSAFLSIESYALRFMLGVVFMFLPIFFANLIFSREFRDTEQSTRSFGWNLLGAVAGGGLEYLSLVTGYRNLLWIVAVCYLLAAIFTYLRTVSEQETFATA
jgi:Spermidine synthase